VLSYLIFGITYAFAAAVQPGPLLTYIISQTLKKGWRSTLPAAFAWRSTLPAAFAPVISDIPILILILFLLSTMPDSFIFILRIGGGLFLLYLGFRAFKSWQVVADYFFFISDLELLNLGKSSMQTKLS